MASWYAYAQAQSKLASMLQYKQILKDNVTLLGVQTEDATMTSGRKSLFMFLMGLAWKCRFSMPLLLSGSVAVLGHAWMFQIRVHTVHRLHDNELAYYEDEEEGEEEGSWETESTDSWETIVEEVAYG
ncbi:hypothetical protein MSG28_013487 [Choristoneura fumiferana]|uniref:Uncharacterized protein n=1 Tax=Choristoneura fumiferana TaxID=7141 RepID=A0ACC0KU48_CHOFU|nr:hypothetical protein MSG28_013487 [Choristoneura fumiferana]